MENITLIGMPGSGKSTVGVVLAKTLGYSFLDVDLVIQERQGKLLQELLNTLGSESFLDLEGGDHPLPVPQPDRSGSRRQLRSARRRHGAPAFPEHGGLSPSEL